MEFHGEIGILEQVSSEHENDAFIRLHKAQPQQFLQARKSDGGSRLAANPFSADLSFSLGDLDLAYLVAGPARSLNDSYCLFPGSRIADADGGGASFWLHGD